MKSIRKILKRKRKVLIAADDGTGIRGIIADHSGVRTEHHFAAGTALKKVLEFGKDQNASCVLCLRTADVLELDVKLGQDLDPDERRAAIEYAASSAIGDRSGSQRISYLDGMYHDFRSGLLVSAFDTDEICDTNAAVKSMKMEFLGLTNFKQFLLAQHFSDPDKHGDVFLFLLGSHGLAAIPERNRLQIRNLPFGIPEEGNEAEWKERAQRRLNTLFRNKRVCVYTPCGSEQLCTMLQEICDAEQIEPADWEEALAQSAVSFLKNGHQLIHTALPPPKEKDPKAAGTWIGFLFLLIPVLSLGVLACKNHFTGIAFEKEIAANRERSELVKQEANILKNLERQVAEQQEILSVLKRQKRVSDQCILVLNLLARYPLQYTRITAIEERSTGIFIEGESFWQPDLSSFFAHFEKELSKYHLTLISDGLSKEKDEKIIFRSRVTSADGGANQR